MCCVFLVPKFSRLRRANSKPGFQKCVYERRNTLLPFTKRSSSRANAVPDVFTSVGTRFYYSQNNLDFGSRTYMITFNRAHTESIDKTTFLYRNRTLVIYSFGTPKHAGMPRIEFLRVVLVFGSVLKKTRRKNIILS